MMKMLKKLFALAIAVVSVSASAHVLSPGDHVANIELKDSNGKAQSLYQFADQKAVVVMIQGNGCPIVRLAVPELRAVRDQFKNRGVEFVLLNTNLQDTPESVRAEDKDYEFGLPVWMDNKQAVGEAWHVVRTAEVFVIDPKTWTLKFHGSIDDRLSYEKQHPPKHLYLTDALNSMLAGTKVAVTSVNSPGCLINFPNRPETR